MSATRVTDGKEYLAINTDGSLPSRTIIATQTHSTAAVGTASLTALAANENRKYALLINDSDTDIYLCFGTPAVTHKGIRLNANGGAHEITALNLYKGIITAIHGGTGTKTLLVTEGV